MAAENPDPKQDQFGFTIDGEIYPEPESLTIDDHRIIKRYTGYNFRDLAGMSTDALYVDQDGIAAILHISYRHAHSDLSFDEIAAVVGRQNLDVAQSTLEAAQEGYESPLALESTPQPEPSSPRSSASKTKDSGSDSRTSSDRSDDQSATTGTPGSATSSPESAPETTAELAS